MKNSKNSVFKQFHSKLGQWLDRFVCFEKETFRWIDLQQDDHDRSVTAEYLTNDITTLYHQLGKLYTEYDACIFELEYKNKKTVIEKLTQNFAEAIQLTEILMDRSGEFFEENPYNNPARQLDDDHLSGKDYYNYNPEIDITEQVGPFAYTSEISSKIRILITLLSRLDKKCVDLEQKNRNICPDNTCKSKCYNSQAESSCTTEIPPERKSTPLSLSRMAQLWGGDMTVKKIRSLINRGTLSVIPLNRQSYIFDTEHLPKHVIQKVAK